MHNGKNSADQGLGGYYGRNKCKGEKRNIYYGELRLNQLKKCIFKRTVSENKGALPQIIYHKGKKNKSPGPAYGLPAKMTHVGIKGLSACGAEDYLGQDQNPASFWSMKNCTA